MAAEKATLTLFYFVAGQLVTSNVRLQNGVFMLSIFTVRKTLTARFKSYKIMAEINITFLKYYANIIIQLGPLLMRLRTMKL